MQKKILVISATAAILLLAALALGQMLNPQGRPSLKPGHGFAYLVWRDDNGWHLRWSTEEKRRNFTGTLQAIGGVFVDAKGVGLEKKEDRLSIAPAEIRFNTWAAGGQDGIDFRLGPKVKSVRFELFIDGDSRPDRVFIGKAGVHPPRNLFVIQR